MGVLEVMPRMPLLEEKLRKKERQIESQKSNKDIQIDTYQAYREKGHRVQAREDRVVVPENADILEMSKQIVIFLDLLLPFSACWPAGRDLTVASVLERGERNGQKEELLITLQKSCLLRV